MGLFDWFKKKFNVATPQLQEETIAPEVQKTEKMKPQPKAVQKNGAVSKFVFPQPFNEPAVEITNSIPTVAVGWDSCVPNYYVPRSDGTSAGVLELSDDQTKFRPSSTGRWNKVKSDKKGAFVETEHYKCYVANLQPLFN